MAPRSAATFSCHAHALAQCGAPLETVDAALAIARDEVRHASTCADLATRFGAPRARADTAANVPTPDQNAQDLALRLWLVEAAIGETISSALFACGRNIATEPCYTCGAREDLA